VPETISLHAPELTGVGSLTAYLRRRDTGALVNTDGDSLTEDPASSGRFTFTLTESRTGLGLLRCDVFSGSSPYRYGWLSENVTVVADTELAVEDIADAVWEELVADHLTSGSTGQFLNGAGTAGDPWLTSLPGSYAGTQAGKMLYDIMEIFPPNFTDLDINGSGHIVRVTFVDSTQVDDIWTTSLPGSYTGTQAGKILSDILVDTGTTLQAELDGIQEDTENIQSRLPTALFNGRMDSNVQATASNLTFDITGSMTGSVGSVTGAVASVTGAVGSVTGNVGGNVTGSVGSVSGITFPTNFGVLSINGSGHISRVVLVDTTTSNTDLVTAATIADAVWDETVADHLTAGSAGANLNVAFSAQDPWSTDLPGAYTGTQAGKVIADILVDTGTTLQAEVDGIQADTEDIQSRLPAALVGGRMDSNTQATAAALTFDLTGSVSGSVGSVTGAVGSVTGAVGSVTGNVGGSLAGNVGGNVTGSVGSISGITFPTNFASLGINGSGHVSRVTLVDTVTTNTDLLSIPAIADAVWDEATAGHVSAGTFGLLLADILVDTGTTLQAELDGIQADTEDIQSRLPAALVSGRIDASVGAMAANVITASALASDAVTEIAAGSIASADVTILKDRLGYLMATIHGAISNAWSETETYVITVDGVAYTAAYTGLDGKGNRTTTTLSKV
jgi:hypothetical protein